MSRLNDFPYNGDPCLEDLVVWGISPMQQLVNIMDETLDREMGGPEDTTATKLTFIMYELKDKLEDLHDAIYRHEDLRKTNGNGEFKRRLGIIKGVADSKVKEAIEVIEVYLETIPKKAPELTQEIDSGA